MPNNGPPRELSALPSRGLDNLFETTVCPGELRVECAACPRQDDVLNCGVYTIVYGFFLVAQLPLPEVVDILLWRRLLLALYKGSSLTCVLPPTGTSCHAVRLTDTRHVHVPNPPDDDAASLDYIDSQDESMLGIAQGTLQQYSEREKDVEGILHWLEHEVAPVVGRVLDTEG
jgi:hypothetical protein